jgi:hypothetical protein
MSNYVISTDVNGSFDVLSGLVNDNLTSLKLIGRGAAGYGYAIAENTIKQLQNFAGPNSPLTPLKGQMWFDSSVQQLKVYVNSTIGWSVVPNANSDLLASFVTKTDLYGPGGNASAGLPPSKGGTGLTTVGASGYVLASNGNGGLIWADPSTLITGSTTFLRRDASSSPTVDNAVALGTASLRFSEVNALLFKGTAVQAQYADIAERYASDSVMSPGDVVMLGGENEITLAVKDNSVFGVISTNPAVKMNADAGDDNTHPYVALSGRVPVKVVGKVKKFDRLYVSDTPGVASAKMPNSNAVCIGRALVAKDTTEQGFVEVALGAK